MRSGASIAAGFALVLSAALSLHDAAPLHPVERRLRDEFPSVSVQASATFDATQEIVGQRVVSAWRARVAPASATSNLPRTPENLPRIPEVTARPGSEAEAPLQVSHPRVYDDPLVAALGAQRVVLRAVDARAAVAEAAHGTLIYQDVYPSVDAVEVPGHEHSEELLLLRDDRAPLVYDYEIVEMRGVNAVVVDGGAVRFVPERGALANAPVIAGGRVAPAPGVLQIDRPWVVDASGRRSETHARWTLVGDRATPTTLRLTVSAEGLSYPLVVDPSFSATGSLATARGDQTATPLPNGKVLIAGGAGFPGALSSAELYDTATGTFSATGGLATGRIGPTATLLPSGKVLIAGGLSGYSGTVYFSSAELYDPASGTFSTTGSLATGRSYQTATLLPNGKVLVVGGFGSAAVPYLSSAELYDPASGTFSATGSLANGRYVHTATLLPNGKVLIAGGYGTPSGTLSSAELYDPATGTFSATGRLGTARYRHTATLLPNGKVLIAGGGGFPFVSSAELYDPASGTFSAAGNLAVARQMHTATLLPNGKVLIAGGGGALSSAELYDPASGAFTTTGSLATPRAGHTATLLPNGTVLIAGGYNSKYVSLAELFDPTRGTFTASGGLATARSGHSATLLTNGQVLIVGGANGAYLSSAELYDPATGTFNPTGNLAFARSGHTATLLANGQVLIAGGYNGKYVSSAELYDPATGTFSATGNLITARSGDTATLLPNGKVLVAGGSGSASSRYLSSAELYDPGSGMFSATGSLLTGRFNQTATLLPNGMVLVADGYGSSGFLSSAELYDPASGTFKATGSLAAARFSPTATLLPNGKVLVAGGVGNTLELYLSSAELYDPASGTFSATGSLNTARNNQRATLLSNGKVLIVGGARNGGTSLSSAELFDVGQGYADSRRPVVVSAPATLVPPAAITLTGSGFRGDSEASGGSFNSSATNYPLLQLQRVDNEQTLFLPPGSAWTDTSFTSTALSGLAAGYYRATIIANAIPSVQRLVLIDFSTPSSFSATATSASQVAFNWSAVSGSTSYEVYRSSLNGPYALVVSTAGTSATDTGLAENTTYLYKVRAIFSGGPSAFTTIDPATTVVFDDASLGGVPIRAVHFAQLRTAVNAMRAAAGLPAFGFTDPTPSAGTAILRQHVMDLRTALDEARSVLGLLAIGHTDPVIVADSTPTKPAHVTELRAGTQ